MDVYVQEESEECFNILLSSSNKTINSESGNEREFVYVLFSNEVRA